MAETAENVLTQIAVPTDLKRRIEDQGIVDRRSYRSEIIVLLEEAVATRERKGKR